MKKKFLTVLLALFVCVSMLSASMLADSVQKGKVSLGASFGTSGSSEKTFDSEVSIAIPSGNFGFVARLRFDVMFSEKQSATVMASFDRPSKTILVDDASNLNIDDLKNPMYVRLFCGISEHSISSSNLLIAVGVGVEAYYDFSTKDIGGGPATYIRTSYQIPGSHFTFDTTAKGNATWSHVFEKDAVKRFSLEGDVSLGFTYYF